MSTKTEISDGIWFASGLEVVAMPSQVKIAKVSGATYEEAKANVRLVSESKNMLKMLIRIMETYDKGTQTYLDCQRLIKNIESI